MVQTIGNGTSDDHCLGVRDGQSQTTLNNGCIDLGMVQTYR